MIRETYTKQDVIEIIRCYGEDFLNTSDELILDIVNEYLNDLNTMEMESWNDGDLIL